MPSPLLSIAAGLLKGGVQNRERKAQRQREAEDRAEREQLRAEREQQRAARDLETQLRLLQTPGVSLEEDTPAPPPLPPGIPGATAPSAVPIPGGGELPEANPVRAAARALGTLTLGGKKMRVGFDPTAKDPAKAQRDRAQDEAFQKLRALEPEVWGETRDPGNDYVDLLERAVGRKGAREEATARAQRESRSTTRSEAAADRAEARESRAEERSATEALEREALGSATAMARSGAKLTTAQIAGSLRDRHGLTPGRAAAIAQAALDGAADQEVQVNGRPKPGRFTRSSGAPGAPARASTDTTRKQVDMDAVARRTEELVDEGMLDREQIKAQLRKEGLIQ